VDEKELAERLLRGEYLPPDIPRELALAAYRLSLQLRKDKGCCICEYPETTKIKGKWYCAWHKPERK
jgi:hypothetical protein